MEKSSTCKSCGKQRADWSHARDMVVIDGLIKALEEIQGCDYDKYGSEHQKGSRDIVIDALTTARAQMEGK